MDLSDLLQEAKDAGIIISSKEKEVVLTEEKLRELMQNPDFLHKLPKFVLIDIEKLANCIKRYADDSTTYREYKRWKWTWECEKCDWIEYSWEQTNLNYNYCPGCGRRITNYYYWEGDEEEI